MTRFWRWEGSVAGLGSTGWIGEGRSVVAPAAPLRPAAARKGLRPNVMRPKAKALGYPEWAGGSGRAEGDGRKGMG